MDDPYNSPSQAAENKNVLPDVVHSQQIPSVGNVTDDVETTTSQDVADSCTESISEHIPSKLEYSTDSEDGPRHQVVAGEEKVSGHSEGNAPMAHSPSSDHIPLDAGKLSVSWPIDPSAVSDVHISEESPVNLVSEISKEASHDHSSAQASPQDSPAESPHTREYLDSLESSHKSEHSLHSEEKFAKSDNDDSLKNSSGSEEIIKLDIRGQAAPKFSASKIIFGPPPEGGTIFEPTMKPIPMFPNLLSPFLVGANEAVKLEDVFEVDNEGPADNVYEVTSIDRIQLSPDLESLKEAKSGEISPEGALSDKIEQSDLLIEEIDVDEEMKERENPEESLPKSIPAEETMSFSTMTTDYKTICEEYQAKLVHLEDAITRRDLLIEELTVSLQRSLRERDTLHHENLHLTAELSHQHSHSDHDVKAQLSDLYKYQSLIKDDSTKFYSAVMSGGSSLSSNGEKDNNHEEITVNHSRSDLKSSDTEDFQTGFESKVGFVISKFDEYIEENLRNKLRESLIQVLCDEIGKMRLEFDTEMKEMEHQWSREKQAFVSESRKLRELLASVKAGDADIDELRRELAIKHEKEMANLRTYFEKKCSDMERSYSEEVYRRCAGSVSSLEGECGGGDRARRRTRSAELPSLSLECAGSDPLARQLARRYEQQLEEMKAEHAALVAELQARQRDAVAGLEHQVSLLKAHIQNSESNVLYPQDVDSELEKKMEAQLVQRIEEVREQVRQDVVNHLQEQLQVLLSDPDAEVSSWPLELVALRDKIHGDKAAEKELSSLRDEVSGSEDKWRQRRNLSFDQNRQLDEVTKERDELRRVAVSLHAAVGQLVAYCASAEDELNRTVLAHLLARLLGADESLVLEDSRPGTPDLNTSAVSRSSGKHVHFAPDLHSILADLDEDGIAGFVQQQRDVSADIKRELEHSLRRLRHEATSLLELSERLALKKDNKMLESSVQVTELVQQMEEQKRCENCELHRKNMEDAMSECLQRESLLRADLDAAMMKIAQLMTSADVIAEGYGTGMALQQASRAPRRVEPGALSPEPASPRTEQRLHNDLEAMQRERDDLAQQLEAANRQLKSTRQFVEEQAGERETERDEFARRERELRDEVARLSARLQNNARILSEMHCFRLSHCNCREHHAHVEQLEAQTREMNQIIAELEAKKAATDEELKATEEKITLLRDIIANLETQLEQKNAKEAEILSQLEEMKNTIEDRDSKMRSLLSELEAMRSERAEQSDVTCLKCGQDEDSAADLVDVIKQQCSAIEERIVRRTRKLERIHEICSTSCSEPSEDVSLRDHREHDLEAHSPESANTPRVPRMSELARVWECLDAHARAEDAALKRIADLEMQRAQLKDIAQEVRLERDVLQARMAEQALRISSLSARVQQQRHDAELHARAATTELGVQLHDARAEVQRLKEELESRDKQLARLRQSIEEKDKLSEQNHSLYGSSSNPKDKITILERELCSAQSRALQLEQLATSLERDKEELVAATRELRRALAEKEDQLQELLALKLDDDNKDEKSEVFEAKASARTLSDIVSISEFDEQDVQMRRAELKAQNLSGARFATEKNQNKTQTPDVHRPDMSSLNIEYTDNFDIPNFTPRADSLPAHLTSTQNKDLLKEYKRNINETTVFGATDKGQSAQIQDDCSMYPNRDVDDTKDNSVEPKKINFSIEPTVDNRSNNEELATLRELGITLEIKQENFPDILTQLKHEIKKSRTELDTCKSDLKNAEDQLCEFPALKEEVEGLKTLLENTMATMQNDKKFYENQLENFSSNKKLLEQRMTELTQEVSDKTKDLHLLKEDILRRENTILELAKAKRNLTNQIAELEVKIDELQSRNNNLEKYESENHHLREKASELQRLEQLVTEKNQQIDSLNQHLDRLDDLQRRLNDKTEEHDNLKEAFDEKSNELFQLQDTVETLNRDIAKLHEDNDNLISNNNELKQKLTKLEKEQENASLKLQNSESELERVNSMNMEMTLKIEELKLLTDKLKDKETEIEILHEDINSFHEEIATLKEQLKMVSRSPSPRKSGEERKSAERVASADKKQLAKIRKQIALLQHELDFNKKELNDKAFELAKANLDVTELRNNLGQVSKLAEERQAECCALRRDRDMLQRDLDTVTARLREESNVSELKAKLQDRVQRCEELEAELQDLRELIDRRQSPRRVSESRAVCARSPTAELERALRDQLDYSHTLDEDIMEQILSASSDDREDIPRLALNSSKSSSSIQSSSSERVQRLRCDNEKLQLQVDNLESRLRDKDALIAELNSVRDKLVQDWQSSRLRWEAERDHCARLQLLLDTHKETSQSLQNQDTNMIQILKKRLESAMASELELQQREQQASARAAALERRLRSGDADCELRHEKDLNRQLSSEVALLKSKLEVERTKLEEAQAALQDTRARAQRDLDAATHTNTQLKTQLADMQRLKHDATVELLRTKELLGTKTAAIAELERRLASKHRPDISEALTEIEGHKSELSRELASFKQCLSSAGGLSAELTALRSDKLLLAEKVQRLEAELNCKQASPDDREKTIRYLQGRVLRLESWRKALVWQKRYLQRVLAGYSALEDRLRPACLPQAAHPKGRFKSAVRAVIAVTRMRFLVRRRQHARQLAAACVLRPPSHAADTPVSAYTGTSPPSRGPPGPRRAHLLRPTLPSPALAEFARRTPCSASSPRDEPFILSSPRGAASAAYLSKLEQVSRCLAHAMHSPRTLP